MALERPAEVMAYIVMAYAVMAITSVGQQARCCGSRTRPAEEVMAYIVRGYGHNECWPTGGVLWLSNDRLKKNLTFKELFAYLSRCYMLIFIPYDKSQSFMYEVYSHGLVIAYVVMAYTGWLIYSGLHSHNKRRISCTRSTASPRRFALFVGRFGFLLGTLRSP